jgi:uncharacterized membrane protein SpoIIM required for sporulation
MLKLAGTDLLGVFLFGGLYTLTATGQMEEKLFQALVLVSGAGFVWLWVLVEAEAGAGHTAPRRAGRAALAFAIVAFAAPALVLGVISALIDQLPPGTLPAGLAQKASLLLLVALFLTACANLVGGLITALFVKPRRTAGT